MPSFLSPKMALLDGRCVTCIEGKVRFSTFDSFHWAFLPYNLSTGSVILFHTFDFSSGIVIVRVQILEN